LNLTAVNGGDACKATSISTLVAPSGSPATTIADQVKTLTLPNGETYQFQYDPTFGLINKITYPTGAWVEYTWSVIPSSEGVQYRTMPPANGGLCAITHDWFAITKRKVSDYVPSAGVIEPVEEQDFNYSTTWPTPGNQNSYNWTSKSTTVTTSDLLRGASFNTIYTYLPMQPPPESVSAWEDLGVVPQENTIAYYDTNGGLLKTVTKTWQTMNLMSGECETLPNGQTSGNFYQYAPYAGFGGGGTLNPNANLTDLPTDVAEYDYGAVSSGCGKPSSTPPRETKTTYASFGNTPLFPYSSILDRLQSVQVYGNGTRLSETDYAYDGGTPPTGVGSVAPSTVTGTPYGQDSQYEGGAITTRGNPTTVTKKCFVGSTGCTPSVTTYTYDTTGQVLTATDGCGNAACSDMTGSGHTAQYNYTDNYTNGAPPSGYVTNAYVKSIVKPTTNNESHTTTFQWGYQDGKMWSTTDVENNETTTFSYAAGGCGESSGFDPFYRLTGIHYPDQGQETIQYCDAGPTPSVTTSTLLSGSNALTKETIYDAMGHPTLSEITSDPQGADITATTYDGLGRVWTVTNPYRGTTSNILTTYYYDALDRPIVQTQPDGNTLEWCYNGVLSSLPTGAPNICTGHLGSASTGTWTDASDETGRKWQRTSDALGRLIEVMEPDGSSTVGKTPSMETDYSYDGLGNLLRVDQWGGANSASNNAVDRARTFSYDSLSRLQTATNPESGTTTYLYDANGNVQSKTDARGVTTNYIYDVLNRVVSKSFTTDASATPISCFQYDISSVSGAGGNLVGRLTNQWTQSTSAGACATAMPARGILTSRSILNYDPMGRVQREQQCVLSNCIPGTTPYSLVHDYDLAGNPTLYTNGTNTIQLTNTYDGAGRLQTITSSWDDDSTHPSPLFSTQTGSSSQCGQSGSYAAFGGLTNAILGNGLMLSRGYDSRLRTNCEIDKGSVLASPTSGSATVSITGSEQSQ
jgi:YD repeat-containing protein